MYTCMHTSAHTYMHACIDTGIQTYMHTCIHTAHTVICMHAHAREIDRYMCTPLWETALVRVMCRDQLAAAPPELKLRLQEAVRELLLELDRL